MVGRGKSTTLVPWRDVVALAVLGVGLALSIVVLLAAQRFDHEQEVTQFQHDAKLLVARIERAILGFFEQTAVIEPSPPRADTAPAAD